MVQLKPVQLRNAMATGDIADRPTVQHFDWDPDMIKNGDGIKKNKGLGQPRAIFDARPGPERSFEEFFTIRADQHRPFVEIFSIFLKITHTPESREKPRNKGLAGFRADR